MENTKEYEDNQTEEVNIIEYELMKKLPMTKKLRETTVTDSEVKVLIK